MNWWHRLVGTLFGPTETPSKPPEPDPTIGAEHIRSDANVPSEKHADPSVMIELLAARNGAALAAFAADNWRQLPDVLHTMHRTMEDLCANAPLADPDFYRRLAIVGDRHRNAIVTIGVQGMDAVAQVLHHADPDARAGACYALQILGLDHPVPAEVIENLGRLATVGTAGDRGPSICALEALAKKQDFSPLQNVLALLLADKDLSIRWRAAKMIADSRVSVTDMKCVEALTSLLVDQTKEVLRAGRDIFGGSYEPPAPEIPVFLRQVAQGKPQTTVPNLPSGFGPVGMGSGGLVGAFGGDDLRKLAAEGSISTKIIDLRSEEEKSIEQEANLGGALGREVDTLIQELLDIGASNDFLSNEPGGKFDANCRHIRTREIGHQLNELGGMQLMQAAYYRVRNTLGGGPARSLEVAWGYIGSWMP